MQNWSIIETTIDFNGNLYLVSGVIFTETFTDIKKYYFLQTYFVKFAKCML